MAEERRRGQRVKTIRKALIVFNNRNSSMDCVLKNISRIGALLEVTSVVGIPDEFELRLEDGSKRFCTVIRRDRNTMAVTFAEI